jgi:hypothetical protein
VFIRENLVLAKAGIVINFRCLLFDGVLLTAPFVFGCISDYILLSCCVHRRTVGKHQSVLPANSPRRNHLISGKQTREHFCFFAAGYYP